MGTIMYRSGKAKPFNASDWKYYLKTYMVRTVEFDEFVSHMATHNTNFSRGTIHGVLTDMLDCLQELLLDGKNVRFGDLGLFSIRVNSAMVDAKEQVNAGIIKRVRLNLSNTKTWSNKELAKRCSFKELPDYESGKLPAKDNEVAAAKETPEDSDEDNTY